MKIVECMKKTVISVPASATIAQAAKLVASKRAGILPVLDDAGKPIGMIQISDLVALVMPDFLSTFDNLDFIPDFGMVEMIKPDHDSLARPISTIMEPLNTIDQDCGLLRAFAIMMQNSLFDLVVTGPDGKLVGLVSRVDIGAALINLWSTGKK